MTKLTQLLPAPIKRGLKRKLLRVETARVYELVTEPNPRPLQGKVAVVTGASGAIGRAIAVRLAVDGASIVAVARGREKLNALVDEISELGGSARAETVDITDAASIFAAAEKVGSVHILVNNAGGSSRENNAHIWEQTPNVVDDLLNVNLRAVMLTTAAFGKSMVSLGAGGRIINIGSTVGVGGLSRFSDYAAVKAGVAGYTRSAALEFGPLDITVNCVTPGIIQRGHISPAAVAETIRKGVLPRLGRAEDVAELVSFLAGPRGGWITGQELIVDGGRSLGLHGER